MWFSLLLLIRANHAHVDVECYAHISRFSLQKSKIETLIAIALRQTMGLVCFELRHDNWLDFSPNCLSNLNGFLESILFLFSSLRLTNGVKLTLHHVTMCLPKAFSQFIERIENMTNFRPWKFETVSRSTLVALWKYLNFSWFLLKWDRVEKISDIQP